MKGQAAIEYLVMYLWAAVVMALVVGFLWVMTQNFGKTEQCNASLPGILCNDPPPQASLGSDGTVEMSLAINNNRQDALILKKVSCVRGEEPPNWKSMAGAWEDAVNVVEGASGSEYILNPGGQAKVIGVSCYEREGSKLRMGSGQVFRGTVLVQYNYLNDIDQSRTRTLSMSVVTQVSS